MCVTRTRTCCEDFCGRRTRKWRPKFPKCLMRLAHNSNTCLSVVIWFSIFRRKLLQLEWSKSVKQVSVEFRYISRYITEQTTSKCSAASVTRSPHSSTIIFKYVEGLQLFIMQQNIIWIYLYIPWFSSVSGLKSFIPPFSHAYEDFARNYRDRKVKKINK